MQKIKINRDIHKDENDTRSSITLKRDDTTLRIHFEGNLDLYFSLCNFVNDSSFYIGIDNYQLYRIFDTLYNDIMNGITGSDDEHLFDLYDDFDDYKTQAQRKEQRRIDAMHYAHEWGLIDEETINWKSDDYPEDTAPILRIEKLENSYKLTFSLPEVQRPLEYYEKELISDYKDGFISVRICNSGSRYQMFNGPFMKAFNALLELEIDNHQIHLAEYLLDKKLENGEPLEKILTFKKSN